MQYLSLLSLTKEVYIRQRFALASVEIDLHLCHKLTNLFLKIEFRSPQKNIAKLFAKITTWKKIREISTQLEQFQLYSTMFSPEIFFKMDEFSKKSCSGNMYVY